MPDENHLPPAEEPIKEGDPTDQEAQEFLNEEPKDLEQAAFQLTNVRQERDTFAATVGTLTEEVNTAKARITELEGQLAEVQNTSAQTQEQVTSLEAQIAGLNSEKEHLLDANTQLNARVHETLAERVVDLKVSLGRLTGDRAEEVTTHVSRTVESLQDSLKDLLTEVATKVITGEKIQPQALAVPSKVAQEELDGQDPNATPSPKVELTTNHLREVQRAAKPLKKA